VTTFQDRRILPWHSLGPSSTPRQPAALSDEIIRIHPVRMLSFGTEEQGAAAPEAAE
jgi:hypothetical protein